MDIATAQRDAAKARLDLVKAGATSQQIDIAKARVAQAQAAVHEPHSSHRSMARLRS